MKAAHILVLSLAAIGLPAAGANAEEWVYSVRVENDYAVNTDHYYTNGVAFAAARKIGEQQAWQPAISRLPGFAAKGDLIEGFDLGQIVVTPTDTERNPPDPLDRPYAGLLYFSGTWQRLSERGFAAFKLVTGVVGPASVADKVQGEFHRWINNPIPRGWSHQLKNEPILNVVYERRTRLAQWGDREGWNGDAIGVGGAMLGNVLTQGYVQLQLRAGWRVPPDYGNSLIRGVGALPPPRMMDRWGFHVFASAGGAGVARNITLDGSTWRDSPSVPKNSWLCGYEVGATVRGPRWQATFSVVRWSREFKAQPKASEFGTLSLSVSL